MNPIETAVRARIRTFVEALIGEELDAVLARPRYGRRAPSGNAGAAASILSRNCPPAPAPGGVAAPQRSARPFRGARRAVLQVLS
jgi:hypothetical protein